MAGKPHSFNIGDPVICTGKGSTYHGLKGIVVAFPKTNVNSERVYVDYYNNEPSTSEVVFERVLQKHTSIVLLENSTEPTVENFGSNDVTVEEVSVVEGGTISTMERSVVTLESAEEHNRRVLLAVETVEDMRVVETDGEKRYQLQVLRDLLGNLRLE